MAFLCVVDVRNKQSANNIHWDGHAMNVDKCYNQFVTLHKRIRMTFHKLQYCSGGQYSYPDYDSRDKQKKNIKAANCDQIIIQNIIVKNICNEYCSRYNKMYGINFIKPL